MRTLIALPAALLAIAACRGSESGTPQGDAAGGTLVVSTNTEPQTLVPAVANDLASRAVVGMIFDRLAEIGPEMMPVGDRGFTGELAERWTWAPDSLSIAFHLSPRARWHDGAPVRASDVRFTFELGKTPGSLASSSLRAIDSVTVRDSLTPVFWFARRYPHQFFDAVYHLHIMPEHLLRDVPFEKLAATQFARNPVGSARFRFARWDAGSRLELVSDTANWRGRAKLDRVLMTFTADPNAVFTRVFAGEADLAEPLLNPALLAEVARRPELALKSAPGMTYAVLQFNMRDPKDSTRAHAFLGDARVRRALSMAVDRDRLVKSVFDTLAQVALGPMTRAQALGDTTVPQLPYDPERAKALLDSAGWRDDDGDGIRSRGGREMRLEIPVPSTSATRQRAAVLLQDMLRQVGVRVDVAPVELKVAIGRMRSGDWDAFLNAFGSDPTPSGLHDTWGPDGALNFGKWVNPVFTAYADSGASARDAATAKRYLSRAYATIVADAPGVWLYEVRNTAVVHSRFQTTGMRPDEWWAGLADWTVPEDKRIDRDRIGLRVAAR